MKKIYFFFFTLLIIFHSQAQETHPADSSRKLPGPFMLRSKNELLRNVYDPERGYFQKAFTDKDDPRFMITNEDETFKFGIGGFVNVLAFMDFDGMVEFPDFVTSQIPVPMGKERGQFGLGAANSRINFKVVGKAKKQTIVGFIETDFRGTGNALRLRHAYISYFGFTVGQTWSTFMDLEAGPPTIDQEGPNTQIATRQPMIRYSGNFTPKLSFSVAIEMNTPLIFDYSSFGIQTEYPHLPDIPAILKFKDKFGHVQLAGIVRTMNYYDDTLSHSSITEWGYGGAISGKFNLPGKFYIYYQAVAGKGISQYVQDLSFSCLDLVLDPDRTGRLKAMTVYGGYVSLQKDWRKDLYSAIVYSFTKLDGPNASEVPQLFSHTHYAAVNLFWDFIPYGLVGIEYLFGRRVNQSGESANANRVNLMFRYGF